MHLVPGPLLRVGMLECTVTGSTEEEIVFDESAPYPIGALSPVGHLDNAFPFKSQTYRNPGLSV